MRPRVLPAGPLFLPARMILQPSRPHVAPHGAVYHSLPSDSRLLCQQPHNPRSEGAADRAGTVVSRGSYPASPSASCPERSGSHRGHGPSCSRTPDTAAVLPAQVPIRHLRPVLRCWPPPLPWQPPWPLCPSSFCSRVQSLLHSAGPCLEAALRASLGPLLLQPPLHSVLQVAPSRWRVAVLPAPWSRHGGPHTCPWASLLSWPGVRRWSWPSRWSPRRGPRLLL